MRTSVPSRRALRRRLLVAAATACVSVGAVSAAAPARAASGSTVFTSPVEYSAANPCTGKTVTVDGIEHDAYRTGDDGKGGLHVDTHYTASDLRGTDEVGNVYRASYTFHDSFDTRAGRTSTFLETYRFVGQGSTANFTVRDAVHVTVLADGTVTSTHEYSVDPVCRR
jgi:hypothetical protein